MYTFHFNHDLTLSMRTWKCPICGAVHDRDLLAANNIKRFAFNKLNTAGTAEIKACGDMTGGCSGQPSDVMGSPLTLAFRIPAQKSKVMNTNGVINIPTVINKIQINCSDIIL